MFVLYVYYVPHKSLRSNTQSYVILYALGTYDFIVVYIIVIMYCV